MKKLIPALCMLLVAAALLGTSTFAWFSMNKQVEASGMQIKANAPSSLYIDTNADMSQKDNAAGFSPTASQLYLHPSSTAASTWTSIPATGTWYKATGTTFNDGTRNGDAEIATFSTEANASNPYLKVTYYIMSEAASVTNLKVSSINVKDTSADPTSASAINPSLRVLFAPSVKTDNGVASDTVITTSKMVWAAPLKASNATQGLKSTTELESITWATLATSGNAYDTAGATATLSENNVLATALGADDILQVDLYIYFDGEDTSVTTANAAYLDTLDITVTFVCS